DSWLFLNNPVSYSLDEVYWFLKALKLFFCLGSLRFSFQFGLLSFRSASLQRFIKLAKVFCFVKRFLEGSFEDNLPWLTYSLR
ncbi:hypothetical protein, partial [Pseudanabaena sp. 'Roaring Creek']|uniref:hypothetical protein n=1 Tax=Pseudanabaena sp. 'Roaring Creek' TaxID=1681830 RepID=UPI000AB0B1E3